LPAGLLDNDAIKRLTAHGLLHPDSNRLVATPQGLLVLNSLLAEIVADEAAL